MALIAGIVGYIGVININNMSAEDIALYEENTLSLASMGKIGTTYQLIRVNTRDILIYQDQASQEKYLNNIKALDGIINQMILELDKNIKSNEVRESFDAFQLALEKYIPVRDNYIKLIMDKKVDEARRFITDNSQSPASVDKSMDQLREVLESNAGMKATQNTDLANKAITTMLIVIGIGMLTAIFLGIFLSQIISRPLSKIVGAANSIAEGDLDVVLKNNSKDEVGLLAAAFRRMIENLNEVITNISSSSEQVAAGSRQVSDSSQALSQGATEQASSIEQLTASIEEISSQTRLNAQNANEANALSEAAKANASQGNEQMRYMLRAMSEINDASNNISKIIKVIDEIAFQTNILALNAAVEAARAGQHGKGFAVVAEEVRNLAARSANAAKETTAMIEGSIKKVDDGTKIANETASALNKIVGDISKVAVLINEIATASNEQSVGISQINQGIMQVSEVVQTNSATSEETAAASEELSEQAESMRTQVSRFKLKRIVHKNDYRNFTEMNPEVMRILENMAEKKRTVNFEDDTRAQAAASSTIKISLSDKEFGKY